MLNHDVVVVGAAVDSFSTQIIISSSYVPHITLPNLQHYINTMHTHEVGYLHVVRMRFVDARYNSL